MIQPLRFLERLRSALARGDEAEIESLDRRAFLRGMTVTAAGLIVPVATISLPAAGSPAMLSPRRLYLQRDRSQHILTPPEYWPSAEDAFEIVVAHTNGQITVEFGERRVLGAR